MLNKKILLVLAMAMLSFVTASPGSVRKLQDDKKDNAPGSGVTLKHFKGKDNGDDEIDLDLKIKTCKKDSKECDDIVGDDEAKEVSMAMFAATMADDMVDALESDDEDDRRKLERELYYCYYYYYCGYYYCYYRYVCY
jgi:hypothetical protein